MNFETEIPALVFTSNIEPPVICVDESSAQVTLSHGSNVVYSSRLYAYDGFVTACDIREAVEEYMLEHGLSCATFTLRASESGASSVGAEFTAIYCADFVDVDASEFLAANFLAAAPSKRTYRGVSESLSFYADSGEVVTICYAVTLRIGGVCRSFAFHGTERTMPASRVASLDASYANVRSAANTLNVEYDELVAWSIRVGSRSASFYLAEGDPDISICFKNRFNCPEFAHIACVSERKTKVSKSLAVIGAALVPYDQQRERSYEIESSPLEEGEMAALEQLFNSPEAKLCASSADMPTAPLLIISEGDFSVSDADDSLRVAKFSYRFADERRAHPLPSPHQRIFSNTFEQSFG